MASSNKPMALPRRPLPMALGEAGESRPKPPPPRDSSTPNAVATTAAAVAHPTPPAPGHHFWISRLEHQRTIAAHAQRYDDMNALYQREIQGLRAALLSPNPNRSKLTGEDRSKLAGEVMHLKQENKKLRDDNKVLAGIQWRARMLQSEVSRLTQFNRKAEMEIVQLRRHVRESETRRKQEVHELKEYARKKKKGIPITDAEKRWVATYEKLKAYREKFGTANPKKTDFPKDNQEYRDLAEWVKTQRLQYKSLCKGNTKANITLVRVKLLNKLDFNWEVPRLLSWDERYEQLVKYKAEHGHTRCPQGKGLGNWVLDQRKFYKQLNDPVKRKNFGLNEERVEKLEALGFEWSLKNMKRKRLDVDELDFDI